MSTSCMGSCSPRASSLRRPSDGARYPIGADGAPLHDVLDVHLAPTATPAVVAARHVLTSSACGICGAESLEHLQRPSRYRLGPTVPVAPTISSRGPNDSEKPSERSLRPAVCMQPV